MRGIQVRQGTKKGMRFMLMPLVDVIFLLLTFFMLSSNLAPYSALMLGDYRREDGSPATAQARPTEAQTDVILTVSAGEVRVNGAALPLADFLQEAKRLKEGGAERVVVFVRPSATAQDIVSVLETLKRTAFASVSVRTRQTTG
jgi:biopolymer transport protein ExbD